MKEALAVTSEDGARWAATEVARDFFVNTPLVAMRLGPPTWVFVDGPPARQEPSIAIRLVASDKPEELLAKTQTEVRLLEQLRERGAQVQTFLGKPRLSDNLVAVISPYLPGETVSYADFGAAVASLHNAGTDPALTTQAAAFTPVARTRQTFEYLNSLTVKGEMIRGGEANLPIDLLPVLRNHLEQGEAFTAQMLALSEERGLPLTVVHQDVQPRNVRRDKTGVATLIDLDRLTAGPAEIDLGRPLGQWNKRFGRDPGYAEEFLIAYKAALHRDLDLELVDLGIRISEIFYASALISDAVDAYIRGETVDEWLIAEGVKRVMHLDDPAYRWESREAYLRRKSSPPQPVS